MPDASTPSPAAAAPTAPPVTGGCQCGAVRYALTGPPLMTALCHCRMCRKAHAAPAVDWALYADDQLHWTRGQPRVYASSEVGRRSFCADCGTPLSFTASYIPGLVDIATGSLDDPAALPPQFHCWWDEHLAWVETAHQLPRFAEFPPPPES